MTAVRLMLRRRDFLLLIVPVASIACVGWMQVEAS
jgi:hypothetical protein